MTCVAAVRMHEEDWMETTLDEAVPGARPADQRVLRTAIGNYPHTAALRSGQVVSDLLRLDFSDAPPVANRAFAPMVREGRYDVCEMAIATFLQAKAYGKPLVLLPVTLAARFQEGALLCRADSDLRSPADLGGRRLGTSRRGRRLRKRPTAARRLTSPGTPRRPAPGRRPRRTANC